MLPHQLYQALCPLGRGSEPLDGYKDDGGSSGSWAPIIDGPNQWVQISSTGESSCVQWSHLHPAPPSWGKNGDGNEDMTRHLACCVYHDDTPEPTLRPTKVRNFSRIIHSAHHFFSHNNNCCSAMSQQRTRLLNPLRSPLCIQHPSQQSH